VPAIPVMHYRSRNLGLFPAWAHPEVLYWRAVWAQVRDCLAGEQEIKNKGEDYLKRLWRMTDQEYREYLDSAVFFNMTDRTVNAMVGSLFQRKPKISNMPKRLAPAFKRIIKKGTTYSSFLSDVVEGVLITGRYGILVDMDDKGLFPPFLVGYDGENIIDWQTAVIDGIHTPVQIVVREFEEIPTRQLGVQRTMNIIYRILSLDFNEAANRWEYRQYVTVVDSIDADLSKADMAVHTPLNRGVPLDRIPFRFVGAKSNTPDCDRPPLSGIASLNIAHYRSYAILEHARLYTGMPVWYVQRHPASEKAEYHLGSSVVWEVAVGEKPGIIEFNGNGLKSLEGACGQKEEQIAALGGRLMGGAAGSGGSGAISESGEQSKIKESNERSLLLQVASNVGDATSEILNIWAGWQDEVNPNVESELNTDFLTDMLGARELRAAQQMYQDGIIPIEALHSYLLKAEVVPEWMDIEQFKSMLGTVEQFPNQPDVWARMMGFASNQERLNYAIQQRSMANEEELTQVEWAKVGIHADDWENGDLPVDPNAAVTTDPAAEQHARDLASKAQEETERANLAKEGLTQQQIDETIRKNKAAEALKSKDIDLKAKQAEKAAQDKKAQAKALAKAGGGPAGAPGATRPGTKKPLTRPVAKKV
jgi:hypothetical protein